jgi:outer membrane protein assembly factor BamB
MAELRDALAEVQGHIRPRPGSLERIHARHRRLERNRRVAAGAVAILVAAGGIFGVAQLLDLGGVAVPASPVIDVATASRLAPAWSTQISGVGSTPPVFSAGVLYAASDGGQLYALDARSGSVEWVGQLPVGTVTTPVVVGPTVLVHAAGTLSAFDVGCAVGGGTCVPVWTANTGGANLASPVVDQGVAYVVSSPGGVSAYPVDCPTPCVPTWVAHDPGGHVVYPVAVANGVVWNSSDHALSGFPTTCSGRCRPIVDDAKFGRGELSTGPAVADGVLVVGSSDGHVYAVSTSCATARVCHPLWVGRTHGGVDATPVIAEGRVFVATTEGRMYAFSVSCGTRGGACRPSWSAAVGGAIDGQLVVSGGLVYASSSDGTVSAFSENCATRHCSPVTVLTVGALPPAPAVWDDRVLFTASADGELTAYTVDGTKI